MLLSKVLPPPHWPPPSGLDCWPPPCIPINKGIIFLFIFGLILGFIRLRKVTKNQLNKV